MQCSAVVVMCQGGGDSHARCSCLPCWFRSSLWWWWWLLALLACVESKYEVVDSVEALGDLAEPRQARPKAAKALMHNEAEDS